MAPKMDRCCLSADARADCLAAAAGVDILIAAGAAGVCFLPEGALSSISGLKVAVDLNAVPPMGIADIQATDKAVDRDGVLSYGALGVGGTKMKVHKQAKLVLSAQVVKPLKQELIKTFSK